MIWFVNPSKRRKPKKAAKRPSTKAAKRSGPTSIRRAAKKGTRKMAKKKLWGAALKAHQKKLAKMARKTKARKRPKVVTKRRKTVAAAYHAGAASYAAGIGGYMKRKKRRKKVAAAAPTPRKRRRVKRRRRPVAAKATRRKRRKSVAVAAATPKRRRKRRKVRVVSKVRARRKARKGPSKVRARRKARKGPSRVRLRRIAAGTSGGGRKRRRKSGGSGGAPRRARRWRRRYTLGYRRRANGRRRLVLRRRWVKNPGGMVGLLTQTMKVGAPIFGAMIVSRFVSNKISELVAVKAAVAETSTTSPAAAGAFEGVRKYAGTVGALGAVLAMHFGARRVGFLRPYVSALTTGAAIVLVQSVARDLAASGILPASVASLVATSGEYMQIPSTPVGEYFEGQGEYMTQGDYVQAELGADMELGDDNLGSLSNSSLAGPTVLARLPVQSMVPPIGTRQPVQPIPRATPAMVNDDLDVGIFGNAWKWSGRC